MEHHSPLAPVAGAVAVDAHLMAFLEYALSQAPAILLFEVGAAGQHAVVYRTLRKYMRSRYPLQDEALGAALMRLGADGRRARFGSRTCKVLVFPSGSLLLRGGKTPLPGLELVAGSTWSLTGQRGRSQGNGAARGSSVARQATAPPSIHPAHAPTAPPPTTPPPAIAQPTALPELSDTPPPLPYLSGIFQNLADTPAFQRSVGSVPNPKLTAAVHDAICEHPDVLVFPIAGRGERAIVFRFLESYIQKVQPCTMEELKLSLHELGCLGMYGVFGGRHRRIAVFDAGSLPLKSGKTIMPDALNLASDETFPLN